MLYEKGVLKICSEFTGERPCRSAILIKLLCYFIEIIFRHGCSPINLRHIFRTFFLKSTCGWVLLDVSTTSNNLQKFVLFKFTLIGRWFQVFFNAFVFIFISLRGGYSLYIGRNMHPDHASFVSLNLRMKIQCSLIYHWFIIDEHVFLTWHVIRP